MQDRGALRTRVGNHCIRRCYRSDCVCMYICVCVRARVCMYACVRLDARLCERERACERTYVRMSEYVYLSWHSSFWCLSRLERGNCFRQKVQSVGSSLTAFSTARFLQHRLLLISHLERDQPKSSEKHQPLSS